MNREILRDRFGKVLGIIEKEGDIYVLLDRRGRRLGTYHKVADETRDRYGKVIGKGNWLSALLYVEVKNLIRLE